MPEGINVRNLQKGHYYPEREVSHEKINFTPEHVITISESLLASGRITKEQSERIHTLATAKEVDEALNVLHSSLDEKEDLESKEGK
ncbi:hypothetical protein HY621_00900 [Candidatus Uhrbacteria bacterium]|nr:hypothetical protein [Candidatus Uhrbacteria bacterium]